MVYCIENDGEIYCNEYRINSLLLKKGEPIITTMNDYIIPRGLYSSKLGLKESDDFDYHMDGDNNDDNIHDGVIANDLYDVLLKLVNESKVKRVSKKREKKGKRMTKKVKVIR